ncbi:hypothetical protein LY76DRAFT_69519 [Colletotrichum caudatum]|nr:hypothetical protein LY76DRAFT_69519 [Colletotrichum caudatum]
MRHSMWMLWRRSSHGPAFQPPRAFFDRETQCCIRIGPRRHRARHLPDPLALALTRVAPSTVDCTNSHELGHSCYGDPSTLDPYGERGIGPGRGFFFLSFRSHRDIDREPTTRLPSARSSPKARARPPESGGTILPCASFIHSSTHLAIHGHYNPDARVHMKGASGRSLLRQSLSLRCSFRQQNLRPVSDTFDYARLTVLFSCSRKSVRPPRSISTSSKNEAATTQKA